MRRFIGAFVLLLAGLGGAQAQSCSGTPPANTVCAGPTSGGEGFPFFRLVVPADIPSATISGTLDNIGSTRGSLLERGAATWGIIPPGTSGLPWVSNGAGADAGYQVLTAAGIAAATITSTQIASGTITGGNIASATVANSNLANMSGPALKGITSAGPASPSDLTGLQAEGVLQFLQSGTGAVQRSLDSKIKDWVSALDFAKGDCSTDDSTAIQDAINAVAPGGTVYFPPAPGGCYAIGSGTTITLPTTKSITLLGAGRGDPNLSACSGVCGFTLLKATASLVGGVINTGTTFIRGDRISNMTIWGNTLAAYGLKMDQIDAATFDNLDIYDATTINFRLGDGTHSTQENTLFAIRLDNPATSVLANLPTYNLEINGTNNNISHVKAANAKTANIHSSSVSSNNTYVAVHGYDFFSGAAQAPTNNILVDGSREQFIAWEGDGSSSANVQINGFGSIFMGGMSQFASPLTAQKGIQFATATSGNQAVGNEFQNSTAANTVVQAGTAANPGNFQALNYNGTQGTMSGSRLSVASTVANLPPCNAQTEGTWATVTDATVTTFHSIVAGTGTNHVAVVCLATVWVIGG